MAASRQASPLPSRPYPGIESFHYLDSPIFFARQEESERLHRLVTIYRGVLLYGQQGTGKSSLVNAGFLPLACADGFIPNRLRVQPTPGQEVIVERIPASQESKPPFLPSVFSADDSQSARIVLPAAGLVPFLAKPRAQGYPLLIFDQFEEFVALFEEAPRGESRVRALEAQDNLSKAIVDILRDHGLRVKVLFSFREDYLAKLQKLFEQCPGLPDVSFRLLPVSTQCLHDVIRGPFERHPGVFTPELPDPMAEKLSAAIVARSESRELNLSEVQIACARLWVAPDPEAVFSHKGVQGLLEDFLEDALRHTGLLRDPAVSLLSRMVTDEGLRNVVSHQDLVQRVCREDGFREAIVLKALDALVKETGLVRRERRQDVVFFTIVSEFLVPWIGRQKELRRARAARKKWLTAAAIAVLVAGISLGVSWWIYRSRTVKAIGDRFVREAQSVAQQAMSSERKAQGDLRSAVIKLQDATAALDAKDREAAALTKTVSDLSAKVSATDTEIGKLKTTLAEVEKVAQASNTAKAEIDRLNSQIKLSTSRISDLEAQLKQELANKAQLQTEIQSLTAERSRLLSNTSGPALPARAEMDTIFPCSQPETVVLLRRAIRRFKVRGIDLFLYVEDVGTASRVDVYVIRTQNPRWANVGMVLDKAVFKLSIEHDLKRVEKGVFPPNSFEYREDLIAKNSRPVIQAHFPEGDSIRFTLLGSHFAGQYRAQFEVCRP